MPPRRSSRPKKGTRSARSIDDPSQRRLPPLLRRAWYSLNQAFRRRIAHLSITPDHYIVLRWLHEDDTGGGMTQRALADLMTSDPNTIASVLDRMERAGLLERRPHESDRRANTIRILPKGRKVFREARQLAQDLQSQVLSVLPKTAREQFLENLELLADAAREAAEEAGR